MTGRGDDFEANVRLLNIISTMAAQAVKLNKRVESDRKQLCDESVRLRQELKTQFNIQALNQLQNKTENLLVGAKAPAVAWPSQFIKYTHKQ